MDNENDGPEAAFEPAAATEKYTMAEMAAISTAISLKRLADMMEKAMAADVAEIKGLSETK